MRYSEEIKTVTRWLRKNQTPEEEIIWKLVRNRKLDGLKFYRQFPIIYERGKHDYFFIADFYCHEKKLVLEIDGKIHDYQKEYDENRTQIIEHYGLSVLRIKNEELKNQNNVIEKIRNVCKQAFSQYETNAPPAPLLKREGSLRNQDSSKNEKYNK
jgi:very-short-patch-repair endonuclease